VRLLLEGGAKLESKDYSGHAALSLAVEKGREAIVRLLLQRSAELKSKYPSRTAFLLATENGHEAIVRLFLEKGARLESKGCSCSTALWRAMLNGQEAIARAYVT
jgi:ankyrin repeat protein